MPYAKNWYPSAEQSMKEANAKLVYQCALRAKMDADAFELWYNPKINEHLDIVELRKKIEKKIFC